MVAVVPAPVEPSCSAVDSQWVLVHWIKCDDWDSPYTSLWQQNPTAAAARAEEGKRSVMKKEKELPKQTKGKKPFVICRQRGLYMQRPREGKNWVFE